MVNTKRRILCVDADKSTGNMMKYLPDLQGYELIQARSITEALTQNAGNFDLILLDWLFEDGTGIDLCEKLRNSGASAPILFYADNGEAADIERAMLAGAQGLLIRPRDFTELKGSLSGFLTDSRTNTERSGTV